MNFTVTAVLVGAVSACLLQASPAPKPLDSGPISYYNGACAHCHGLNGSAYGEDFFKKFELAGLSKSIKEMAEGPGQSPLDTDGLSAQVAYHQAILNHAPFIAWTAQDGQKLSGEVTRKATLEASIGRAKIPVTVRGINWTLELPSGASTGEVILTATLNRVSAKLNLGKAAYSVPSIWPPK